MSDRNYNGRINLGYNEYDNNIFQLFDRIPATRPTNYENALAGNQNESELSKQFFSSENINNLQTGIIEGVKEMSKNQYHVGYQSEDNLKMIMRSIYLQHSVNLPNQIKEQIKELNLFVLDYCVPKVYGEAQGYYKYLEDISTIATPIERPVQANQTNKTLELKPWF